MNAPWSSTATFCHDQTADVPKPATCSRVASLGRASRCAAHSAADRLAAGMVTVRSALVPPSTAVPQKQNLPVPVGSRTALPTAFPTSSVLSIWHDGLTVSALTVELGAGAITVVP